MEVRNAKGLIFFTDRICFMRSLLRFSSDCLRSKSGLSLTLGTVYAKCRYGLFPPVALRGFALSHRNSMVAFPLFSSLNSLSLVPRTPIFPTQVRRVSNKQRKKWKIRKYHFKLRLKRTMRKMRVPYVSSKSRGQVKKKPILYDFRPYLRRKLKRAER
jgi:hypothetical protein